MPRIKLTQRVVDHLRTPDPSGRQTLYWDESLPGFAVLVSGKTSARTYIVQRELPDGRTRRVTVASASEMKLDEARKRACRLLVDMRDGVDPKRARRSALRRPRQDAPLVDLPASTVYFVQLGAAIKVGFSTQIEKRLMELRRTSAEEMRVLAVLPGGRDLESYLHAMLAPQRVESRQAVLFQSLLA
jgi:hypothetical protein